ncbi:NupC/NupG family nucleoside CNT transporter [Bacteroidetes bacterium endosymbiont of Geopemphigus sp.]|uniref:NupC/NupG family nucleoside CNT transporter n=1 Tax=Bacteroidetes bacterium endosymbiont of Geopemphigus sp. TaxID=2047937 RepID=UPI000CD06A40|nr:nucleoside transporter C-terminal domain-containing protein [Bacteroidetes bacterium endosymbiont of Geopemphigus sp.]
MQRFTGLLGIIFILGLSYLFSNNRKAINYRLVLKGLLLQTAIALFILKTDIGSRIFQKIGVLITRVIEESSRTGADFVFGVLVREEVLSDKLGPGHAFIFFFNVTATVILICVLVGISYHLGIMQRLVSWVARIVHRLMGISGVEAISNVASAFVGQVEAQIMIRPYLKGMTVSELLASMSGSMACIAGGVMVIYMGFGIPAEYLLAASLMAAPAALVISKIVYPETHESETRKNVKLAVEKESSGLLDAISRGCSDGLKISLNISAMLIGFMALVAMINLFLSWLGPYLAIPDLSMSYILGKLFFPLAWLMGVPSKDVDIAGSLMGTKLVINEFVAYLQLKDLIALRTLDAKTITILSIALCGFANIGSIGIQIGGIGELIPERRKDLAYLAWRALLCGTLASYLSATIAGLLMY